MPQTCRSDVTDMGRRHAINMWRRHTSDMGRRHAIDTCRRHSTDMAIRHATDMSRRHAIDMCRRHNVHANLKPSLRQTGPCKHQSYFRAKHFWVGNALVYFLGKAQLNPLCFGVSIHYNGHSRRLWAAMKGQQHCWAKSSLSNGALLVLSQMHPRGWVLSFIFFKDSLTAQRSQYLLKIKFYSI